MRGALSTGLGKGALAGIVSAEAIALMEGVIKSMTNARLMLVAAAVLVAGLLTAGAGVMGYPATRPESPPLAIGSGQEARQPAAAPQPAPTPPRPAGTRPATDQGPLIIQVEVVDPEGRRLSGADVAATVGYSRGPEDQDSIYRQEKV